MLCSFSCVASMGPMSTTFLWSCSWSPPHARPNNAQRDQNDSDCLGHEDLLFIEDLLDLADFLLNGARGLLDLAFLLKLRVVGDLADLL